MENNISLNREVHIMNEESIFTNYNQQILNIRTSHLDILVRMFSSEQCKTQGE